MKLKMVIVICESVSPGLAAVAAAHASLACYLAHRDDPEVVRWLAGPFHKVVCRGSPEELARAGELARAVPLSESALGGRRVVVALAPRERWPAWIRALPLYQGPAPPRVEWPPLPRC